MVKLEDFLVSYRINTYYGTKVEFKLLHIDNSLKEFLEMNPVYISTEGVEVLYMGSHLILEPRDSPSGKPQGIILPRLPFKRTSEEGHQPIMESLPRPDLTKNRKETSIPASEILRDEWSTTNSVRNSDCISFRNEREAIEYVNGICRVMSELVQAYLSVVDTKKQRAITLIINN